MKKGIVVLTIIFFISIYGVKAVEIYPQDGSKHWAVSYASNLSQRLATIKKSLEGSADTLIEDIDVVNREVLQAEKFNDAVTFNNWQKLLMMIVGEKSDENYSEQNNIRREDAIASMMQILEKRFDLVFSDINAADGYDKFYDNAETTEDKIILIGLAANQGIISGYDDSSFRPKDYLKNSEAIAIIERVCNKYGLPQTQWDSDIKLINIDGFLRINGPMEIEDAFWTNDKGILLMYNTQASNIREAAKVFINENRTIKAFKYDNSNLKENLFNESAFSQERGYLSSNKIIWDKNRKYINVKGELKDIYIPYSNYSVSSDNRMVLMQDEEEQMMRVYDFLTEKSFAMDEYFRWADEAYSRDIQWSPDSRYIISTLFKPEDDIGIEEKNRFAIFDCRSGKLVEIIEEKGYYSYYPIWSADGSKIAFYRVKADDKELKDFLNHAVDSSFNLLAKEIGIYDLNSGNIRYYPHPEGILLGKYQNGLIWSPQGDSLYIQVAGDKEALLDQIQQGEDINIEKVTNEIWKLDSLTGAYTKVISIDENIIARGSEDSDGDTTVFNPLGETEEDQAEPRNIYTVESSIKSVSPSGNLALYMKQLYNMTRYENILTKVMLRDLNSGQEKAINSMLLTDHWWLTDGSLVIVESEPNRSRYAQQTTYVIKRIEQDFTEVELVRLSQYPTSITLSPDKNFLMLHQYRGSKDVKFLDLRKQL